MHRRIAFVLVLTVAVVAAAVTAFAREAAAKPDGLAVVTPLKVTVTERDFNFVLSKKTFPKNRPVVFTITNKGQSVHDFDISGTKGTKVIAPGTKTTQRVTFKKAGRLRYVCSVPRHVQFGMAGYITVK
jgi:uncharacterized cupredoxin-like copper-binding protein